MLTIVQGADELVLEGKHASTPSCPPLPTDHPRITPSGVLPAAGSNVRGYSSHWEIKDERLYLLAVQGRYRLLGSEPLFADWYTGRLRVPYTVDTHAPRRSGWLYEEQVDVKVRNGIVIYDRLVAWLELLPSHSFI